MNALKLTALAGVLATIAVSALVSPAAAQQASNCPQLSNVEWWTNTVSEVRRVVQASYNGSWDAYIDRWKQQQRDLQQALNSGQAVEIKSRGLVFRNDDLKEYIGQVEERVKTLECLKKEFANEDQAAIPQGANQQFATPQETKAIEGTELSLEVSALCEGRSPIFQVTNLGDRWPRLAEVSIFRTDTNGMVTQRRLRMTNSQQMVFKIPDEMARQGAEFGIFIQPTWYERAFQYDATIKCTQ